MKRAIRRTNTGAVHFMPYRCGIAACISVCMGLLLLLLSTAVAYSQDDPALFTRPLALTSLCLSVVSGGYIASRGSDRPILSALICGIITILVLMILSLFPVGKADTALSVPVVLGTYGGVIGMSVIGALIGMKKPRKHSSKHKPRRHQ